MIYSLDLYIKTTNISLMDSIESRLPSIQDSKVISEYYESRRGQDQFDDMPILFSMIRFNSDIDRGIIFDEIMLADGLFTDCEIGSYIKLHDCNLPNTDKTSRRCFDDIVFEVIS